MKNITKIFSFLLLLVFCISLIACGEEEDKGDNGGNKQEDVFKDIVDIILEEGKTYTFEIDKAIILKSLDESVVSVDSETKTITALKAGETKVELALSEDEATKKEVKVTVNAKEEQKPSEEEAKKVAKEMLAKVIEEIGEYSFIGSGSDTITIPSNIKIIPSTLYYKDKIESVYYEGDLEERFKLSDKHFFMNIYNIDLYLLNVKNEY